jgi:flagellar basal-body rod modification protein FlgD
MTTTITDLGMNSAASASGSVAGSSALGKEQFLQLLVTQLQHQNPLEPTSNEDFIAQLATFASLEQLQDINTGTQTGLLMQQSVTNALSTGLIGKDVLLDTSTVSVKGGDGSDFLVDLDADAKLTVTVTNADGETVRTLTISGEDELPLAAGEHEFTWDGKDDAGDTVPDGDYTIAVTAADATGATVPASTWLRGRVAGVRFADGMAYVIVGDMEFNLADVIEIREAAAAAGLSAGLTAG